jgi:hypothetical protein
MNAFGLLGAISPPQEVTCSILFTDLTSFSTMPFMQAMQRIQDFASALLYATYIPHVQVVKSVGDGVI